MIRYSFIAEFHTILLMLFATIIFSNPRKNDGCNPSAVKLHYPANNIDEYLYCDQEQKRYLTLKCTQQNTRFDFAHQTCVSLQSASNETKNNGITLLPEIHSSNEFDNNKYDDIYTGDDVKYVETYTNKNALGERFLNSEVGVDDPKLMSVEPWILHNERTYFIPNMTHDLIIFNRNRSEPTNLYQNRNIDEKMITKEDMTNSKFPYIKRPYVETEDGKYKKGLTNDADFLVVPSWRRPILNWENSINRQRKIPSIGLYNLNVINDKSNLRKDISMDNKFIADTHLQNLNQNKIFNGKNGRSNRKDYIKKLENKENENVQEQGYLTSLKIRMPQYIWHINKKKESSKAGIGNIQPIESAHKNSPPYNVLSINKKNINELSFRGYKEEKNKMCPQEEQPFILNESNGSKNDQFLTCDSRDIFGSCPPGFYCNALAGVCCGYITYCGNGNSGALMSFVPRLSPTRCDSSNGCPDGYFCRHATGVCCSYDPMAGFCEQGKGLTDENGKALRCASLNKYNNAGNSNYGICPSNYECIARFNSTLCCPIKENVCNQPQDRGISCIGAPLQIAYYFNVKSGVCNRFEFLGCGGNDNRFNSIQDCTAYCNRFNNNIDLKIVSDRMQTSISMKRMDENNNRKDNLNKNTTVKYKNKANERNSNRIYNKEADQSQRESKINLNGRTSLSPANSEKTQLNFNKPHAINISSKYIFTTKKPKEVHKNEMISIEKKPDFADKEKAIVHKEKGQRQKQDDLDEMSDWKLFCSTENAKMVVYKRDMLKPISCQYNSDCPHDSHCEASTFFQQTICCTIKTFYDEDDSAD